jgi:hypothetical protein
MDRGYDISRGEFISYNRCRYFNFNKRCFVDQIEMEDCLNEYQRKL